MASATLPLVVVACDSESDSWLVHLRQHVRSLRGRDALLLWSRSDVRPGERTQDAVAAAWARASAVVLLVTPKFLADYLTPDAELHTAALAARARGLPLLWLPISASAWQGTELAELEPLHDPEHPLDGLERSDVNRALLTACQRIATTVHGRPLTTRRLRPPPRNHVIAGAAIATVAAIAAPLLLEDPDPAPTAPTVEPAPPPPTVTPPPTPPPPAPTAPVRSACTTRESRLLPWSGPAIRALAIGHNHRCLTLADDSASCWGDNNDGELGTGDRADRGAPTRIKTRLPIAEVACGDSHTCIRHTDGRVRCIGDNSIGQLGLGHRKLHYTPTTDVPLAAPATQIAAGSRHTCALTAAGTVHCWGVGTHGGLASGGWQNLGDDPGERPTTISFPAAADQPRDPAIQIVAGSTHSCALLRSGAVHCWGANRQAQLGTGTLYNYGSAPGEVAPPRALVGAPAQQLAAGESHTCALLTDNRVRCWGANRRWQLGYDHDRIVGDEPADLPPPDVAIDGHVIQIAAAARHTCVLLADHTVRCWGANDTGQLGCGPPGKLGEPLPVLATIDLGGPVERLFSSRSDHLCALLTDGELRCWGSLQHPLVTP